jgi:hypothetical protein
LTGQLIARFFVQLLYVFLRRVVLFNLYPGDPAHISLLNGFLSYRGCEDEDKMISFLRTCVRDIESPDRRSRSSEILTAAQLCQSFRITAALAETKIYHLWMITRLHSMVTKTIRLLPSEN